MMGQCESPSLITHHLNALYLSGRERRGGQDRDSENKGERTRALGGKEQVELREGVPERGREKRIAEEKRLMDRSKGR